jgi:glycosyltransferase involved in cell wall biosynthesis
MSLGKPAIVTSVGGIPELVENGRTGLLVPPGDAHALAEALLHLLRNPKIALDLGTEARRLYQEQYSPELVIRQIEQLFTGLTVRKHST